ncbi:M50 family metallopeptidase [Pseudolysinimonas kribbensis]|uniref:M50 family metallopeptidase n=1 Tax=Pseudolysinimonas kribbensis TaxID=433641 RepID=UPI0031D6A958
METVLLFVLGVLIIVVGLVVSIGLHELGHFTFAKLFKVRVGQFMIGFGPTLWSRRRGETEYGVKAIPLGGYISMAGMFPPAKRGDEPRDGRPGATFAQPEHARPSTTGLFNVLVQDARDASADTILVGEEERVFYRLVWWKRVIIMLAGPAMNLVLAIVFAAILVCGLGLPVPSTTIADVGSGTPAAAGGLRADDRVVEIDGTDVTSYTQMTALIRAHAGRQMSVVVDRDGSRETLQVTPEARRVQVSDRWGTPSTDWLGQPVLTRAGFLGIGNYTTIQRQDLGSAFAYLGSDIQGIVKIVVTLPARVTQTVQSTIEGKKRDSSGPISLVGIGEIAGQVAASDSPILNRTVAMVSVLAQLNVALFVFNMVPLLPLDGGHVVGAVWEAVRRRFAAWFKRPDPGPVDMAKLVPLTLLVTGVLALMSLALIVVDIVNPIIIS